MEKESTDVEKLAAKIADKQDNPTMHELAKSFPEKSYRELEKYRDEDRQKEAQQIPLTESQKKQDELEPIAKGVCVPGELRKARENSVKHYEDANYRQDDPDNVKVEAGHNETIWFRGECKRLVKERDEAQDALANALEVNESHQKLNGKLQTRVTELEEDCMKLHEHVEKQISRVRKAGL